MSIQWRLTSICRLKSEHNYSEQKRLKNAPFVDDALKTRGNIYLYIETLLLFALRPSKFLATCLCSCVPICMTRAQPGILFGRGQSLTSSDYNISLFCKKMILMSPVNFWSVTAGYDVKISSTSRHRSILTKTRKRLLSLWSLSSSCSPHSFQWTLREAESEAPCNVVLENISDYAYWISQNQLKVCKRINSNKSEDANSQILTLQNTCEHN